MSDFVVHCSQCVFITTLLALVVSCDCRLKLPWHKFRRWPMEAATNYFGVSHLYLFRLVFFDGIFGPKLLPILDPIISQKLYSSPSKMPTLHWQGCNFSTPNFFWHVHIPYYYGLERLHVVLEPEAHLFCLRICEKLTSCPARCLPIPISFA